MLESLIIRWGYLAVGVGTFLEGELVLVTAGALAHQGLLSLPLVAASAFAGSLSGDQLWFLVGKRLGDRLFERRPRLRARSARVESWLARHGSWFVIAFRFVYGIRIAAPLVLGTSGYPTRRFVVLNGAGAAVWAAVISGAGWTLGASLEGLLARSARIEEIVASVLGLMAAGWAATRLVRRRERSRPGGH